MARIVDKESKREAILRATIRVAGERGVFGFKIIDVAREAGVGKGTVYEYFRSKDELIAGCFELMMTAFSSFIAQNIPADAEPDEYLRRFAKASLDFCRVEKELMDVMIDFMSLGIPRKTGEPVLPNMVEAGKKMIKDLSRVFQQGIDKGIFRPHDPMIAAHSLIALFDGLYFQMSMGLIDLEDRSLPDKMSEFILRGVLK